MTVKGMGASATPSGSRASHETPSGSHPSGFDPSRMAEVALRCERAEGPDAYADYLIHAAVMGWRTPDELNCFSWCVGENYQFGDPADERRAIYICEGDLPTYTHSVDAALTLVPDEWRWIMRQAHPDKANPNEKGFFARLETLDFETVTWGKGECWITDHISGREAMCWAATPALALSAAALRAQAIAVEARRAATTEIGAVHDSAGPQDIAQ